ncbi:EAL domain-containing protein [Mycobacterium sp. WMMD1722]|uniref:sensor domain-containing phosphodiesterase n=1 Tax=Mycobacterium sp. WMMD1722 TaxID=3404117 RepID=UPI003BF47FFF
MSVDEADAGAVRDGATIDLIHNLLSFLRHRLDLDTAWLSSFRDGMQVFEAVDGNHQTLGISAGDRSPLSGSYCVRVIDGRLPGVIADTSANPITAQLPITSEWNLGAYVGVPVPGPDGATVGMLCAVSDRPKPHLVDADLRIATQVADLVGTLMHTTESDLDPTADQRNAIRRVVEERDFEVVFQAVHDVTSGKVVGVEALARFPCEPFRPDLFFEQAGSLGLGVELEIAIVERVVSLMPQLPGDVFVAVNISPAGALKAHWARLLADIDPARLVLEITEHDAVPNYGALDDVLESCRTLGMRVAVDDVGAGFASFSHVLELAPDFVKIDKSITRNIDVDDARRRLAQAIAEFSGQIGATAIAEGVETQGELDAVHAAGISWAQGYFLGRPKPHVHGFPEAAVGPAPADATPADVDLLGERRFELALAHSPIGMAVVGLDGKFLRTNRALRSMVGYSRRDLANRTFQDLTHPEDLETDVALMNECLEGRRRSYRIDKRYITADGRVVWGALTVVLVRAPRDQPRCFVSQIVDITVDRTREPEPARREVTPLP